jgi:large subunit ribosomal protein L6
MSRIGKNPIILNDKISIDLSQPRIVKVKGPLGELSTNVLDFVEIKVENNQLLVNVKNADDRIQKAIWGTTRAIINNMVEGVSKGYEKKMELNGVGYKMELGKELTLYIGFSHPVKVEIPPSIKLSLEKNVLTGTSYDKQALGNFFTNVHNMKPCDVYKQKGFKFPGRFYRKKVTKKGK